MGRSGLSVSRLALGTMTWGRSTTWRTPATSSATFLAAGGDLVDTAYGYADGASEEALGTFLGDLVPREEVVVCTKAGISRRTGERVVDTSRRTLMSQLDTSLARLGTSYVDLWLVHTWSDTAPVEETLSALEWAVTSGRARYVGVSNYSGWQSAHAATLMSAGRVPLVANEVEYSLLNREAEDEVAGAATALGLGLLPWSPLGRGVLTGKYRHGVPADSRAASREHAALHLAIPGRRLGAGGGRGGDRRAGARGVSDRGGAGVGARPAGRGGPHRRGAHHGPAADRAGVRAARAAGRAGVGAGRRLGLSRPPAPRSQSRRAPLDSTRLDEPSDPVSSPSSASYSLSSRPR